MAGVISKFLDFIKFGADDEDMYDDEEKQNHLATLVNNAEGFRNVNKLCYLYAIWDKLRDEGWKIYYYDNY